MYEQDLILNHNLPKKNNSPRHSSKHWLLLLCNVFMLYGALSDILWTTSVSISVQQIKKQSKNSLQFMWNAQK